MVIRSPCVRSRGRWRSGPADSTRWSRPRWAGRASVPRNSAPAAQGGLPDPDGFFDGPMPAQKTTLQKVRGCGARTIPHACGFGDDRGSRPPDREGQRGCSGRQLSEASERRQRPSARGDRWFPRFRGIPSGSRRRGTSSTMTGFAGQEDPSIPRRPGPAGSLNARTGSLGKRLHGPANPKRPQTRPEHPPHSPPRRGTVVL